MRHLSQSLCTETRRAHACRTATGVSIILSFSPAEYDCAYGRQFSVAKSHFLRHGLPNFAAVPDDPLIRPHANDFVAAFI